MRAALREVRSREDAEQLRIEGISVGDLIYDRVLRKHYLVTLEIESPEFERAVRDVAHLLVFWSDYLAKHDVRAVIVSHEAYLKGVVARVGMMWDVPVFCAGLDVVRLVGPGTQNIHISHVRRAIASLGLERVERHRDEARRRLRAIREAHSRDEARTPVDGRSARSDHFAVAVLPHCFWDSPHVIGHHLFPDYWQWLQFIGAESRSLQAYRWYVKRHPDGTGVDDEALSDFVRQFPHFSLIGPSPTPADLVALGVRCVLTVYGSAGAEFAALGVPTVFASTEYPGHDFGIGIASDTREQLRQHLRMLPDMRQDVDELALEDYFAAKGFIATALDLRKSLAASTNHEDAAAREPFTIVNDDIHAALKEFVRSGKQLFIP